MKKLSKAIVVASLSVLSAAAFAQAPNVVVGGNVDVSANAANTVLGLGISLGGANKTATTVGTAHGDLNVTSNYTNTASVGNMGGGLDLNLFGGIVSTGMQTSMINVGIAVGGANCNVMHIGSLGADSCGNVTGFLGAASQ